MAKRVLLVAGARPNYMKIAPIHWAIQESVRAGLEAEIIHTGQHYDRALSADFFRDLRLPPPAIDLAVGSGTHAEQTARVMVRFERVLADRKPDVVVVAGDVNSTAACALVTAKALFSEGGQKRRPVLAHVEAGLRSRDRAMPEEINRIVTDSVADLLFTTCAEADQNLLNEGVPSERIHRVGNPMVDSLLRSFAAADHAGLPEPLARARDGGGYGLCTLHRPSNVDSPDVLGGILDALDEIAGDMPIFFPLHPRTRTRIQTFGFGARLSAVETAHTKPRGLVALEPLSYLSMLVAQRYARVVLTDSGGIQEETTAFGVPCVTVRDNTERAVTIREGTNVLAGTTRQGILHATAQAMTGPREPRIPELWDGHAGERMVRILEQQAAA